MKRKFILLLLLYVWCFQALAQHTTLPIAGKWQFRLDPLNIGLKENWHDQTYRQTLHLPGTLDDAGIGAPLKVDTTNLNVNVPSLLIKTAILTVLIISMAPMPILTWAITLP